MLRAKQDSKVRVFVVWMPVLPTDWGELSPAITSNLPDWRASHFWDRDRRLSAMYGDAGKLESLAEVRHVGFAMKDVLWDAALVYPPGVKWGSTAKLLVAPVVKYRDVLDSQGLP